MSQPLRILIADDELVARKRLARLLSAMPDVEVAGEAADGEAVLAAVRAGGVDVVLLDIHMPGADGLALAQVLRTMPEAPPVVFVTAYAEHAVTAFQLEAVDYLTKPVRLERLEAALGRVEKARQGRNGGPEPEQEVLVIQDRGRTERVPLPEVLYLKAELKYVTVRTATRSYILDGSLSELEERHGSQFLRVHRNALVARRAVRALEKHYDPEEGEGWAVRLNGIDELLAVSRRQLGAVREAIAG